MSHSELEAFIDECRARAKRCGHAALAVEEIAPVMHAFMREAERFLKPEHFRADPDHYARNAVYISPQQDLSLFALVWSPGQWTPIHDHGSWGVVGVLRGTLHERSYVRIGADHATDADIDLRPGGVFLLDPGTITSFVPNPDHIHRTGVPENAPPVVSLHLYGRNMDSFHIYDLDTRSRRRVNVAHNES
jgi:predicted metal-dependent enzyme (double-stranded beta helix superfamily)